MTAVDSMCGGGASTDEAVGALTSGNMKTKKIRQ